VLQTRAFYATGVLGGSVFYGIQGMRSLSKGAYVLGFLTNIAVKFPIVGGRFALFGCTVSSLEGEVSVGSKEKTTNGT